MTLALAAGRAGRGLRLSGGVLRARASGTSRRPRPDAARAGRRAAALLRAAEAAADRRRRRRASTPRRPSALRRFAERHGIPVGETQAGKGVAAVRPPAALGAIGVTGTLGGQRASPREADVVLGVGTRLQRLHHRARRPLFQDAGVRFVDAQRRRLRRRQARARCRCVGDARAGARGARRALGGWTVAAAYRERGAQRSTRSGTRTVDARLRAGRRRRCPPTRGDRRGQRAVAADATSSSARPAACRASCTSSGARATRAATTSNTATPAWATRSPAASASRWPRPDREVFVMVGDGSYLMMSREIATSVQEGLKLDRRPPRQPRLRSSAACPLARHATGSARATATGGRTRRSTATAAEAICRSIWRRTRRARRDVFRATTIEELRDALVEARASRPGRDPHRRRPLRGRAGLRELVGRAGGGGVRRRVSACCPRGVRAARGERSHM